MERKHKIIHQRMSFVPDHFFCFLSTFVHSLCPEEIGSPFSARSRFIQRVYSSLSAMILPRNSSNHTGHPRTKLQTCVSEAGDHNIPNNFLCLPRPPHEIKLLQPKEAVVNFGCPIGNENAISTFHDPRPLCGLHFCRLPMSSFSPGRAVLGEGKSDRGRALVGTHFFGCKRTCRLMGASPANGKTASIPWVGTSVQLPSRPHLRRRNTLEMSAVRELMQAKVI